MDETLWGIMTIVGPVILLVVLLWSRSMRRNRAAASEATTEQSDRRPITRTRSERRDATGNDDALNGTALPAGRRALVREPRAGRRAATSSRCSTLARAGRSALLVAATGAGKTLAGFLPTICDLAETPAEGLHTLYVSPLKALAVDVQRNLLAPIEEMGLRSGSRPAPATRRRTARRASACGRRISC